MPMAALNIIWKIIQILAWTYGDAGNITTRKEYAYTTGTLGSVQSTVNYTYDGTWGDLLTGYNGKTITSDTIGNMLSDGTRTYTWEHGRELSGMTGNAQDSDQEISIDFAYNADGLRTSKTVTTKIYAQTQYTVSFVADSVTVHTLTVDDGYTLTSADYPEVPATPEAGPRIPAPSRRMSPSTAPTHGAA